MDLHCHQNSRELQAFSASARALLKSVVRPGDGGGVHEVYTDEGEVMTLESLPAGTLILTLKMWLWIILIFLKNLAQ
jgi:hypothetical protein